jgi:hypothetical protein
LLSLKDTGQDTQPDPLRAIARAGRRGCPSIPAELVQGQAHFPQSRRIPSSPWVKKRIFGQASSQSRTADSMLAFVRGQHEFFARSGIRRRNELGYVF